LRVTILGAGTLVPHPERGAPGLAVTTGKETLLFDSGSGTLYRAARAWLDWREISHIFYTHYHPDHTLDLVSFLFASNYTPNAERIEDLNIYGPCGLNEFYKALGAAWPSVVPKNFRLNLRELAAGETVESGSGWVVQTALVAHGDTGALAYRVTSDTRSVVYSGDTEYCPALVSLARGADLLVCECSADDAHQVPGHLSPSGVTRVIRESGVRRVLLTHVYPPLNPAELARICAQNTGASVEAARDMSIHEV